MWKLIPGWFPGAGFKRQAEDWKRLGNQARCVPYDHVKAELVGAHVMSRNRLHIFFSFRQRVRLYHPSLLASWNPCRMVNPEMMGLQKTKCVVFLPRRILVWHSNLLE